MVQSLYGREYFPNGGAYLQRFALTGSIYGGPPALELIEVDAKGDRVFAKIHVTAPAGFEWDVYQIIDMDPNPGLTFKFTALDLYSEGGKQNTPTSPRTRRSATRRRHCRRYPRPFAPTHFRVVRLVCRATPLPSWPTS